MALGGTDINLLLPVKVPLEEGNVTRAGRDYEITPLARDLLRGAARRPVLRPAHRWLSARLDALAVELAVTDD